MTLTAEQLLAGSSLREPVNVPAGFVGANGAGPSQVVLRPLAVRDLQLIERAAKDDEPLRAALMIQQALVEPALKVDQINHLQAGLATWLLERINRLSGISASRDALDEMVQAPLARACFVLAKEFGWTPEDVSGMTIGQILLYLEMTRREKEKQ
ncbi:MAG: hypothetical protein R2729_19450 [Bryobacteraceae bacterium]